MKPRSKKLRLYSIDTIDANIDRKDTIKHPLFLTNVELQSSKIVLNPNIDEIQQLMQQLINYILNIFHGVRKWGEVRQIDSKLIHNYPMNDFSELLPSHENIEIDKLTNNEDANAKHIQQGENLGSSGRGSVTINSPFLCSVTCSLDISISIHKRVALIRS